MPGCLLKQAGQKSVLLQYFFSTFPRNSVPPQQKNSVLFQYLQLTKFEKFQKFMFLAQIATESTKTEKIPDLLTEFPHFFSTSGPPLKNQYYFRTFRKFRTCRHPAWKVASKISKYDSSFSGRRNLTQFQGWKIDSHDSIFHKHRPVQFLSEFV